MLPTRPQRKASQDWILQLINIVFLMLIFLMANGSIANVQDQTISLPLSRKLNAGTAVGDAAYVTAAGELRFRGLALAPAAIAEQLRRETAGGEQPRYLQVVVDRRLPAVRLIDILQELRKAGFSELTLVTIREVAT